MYRSCYTVGTGIILGVISLGLTSFFIVLFGILFLVLFTWVRRQVRVMRRYCQKEKPIQRGREDRGENGAIELNQVSPIATDVVSPAQPTVISATNHAFTSSDRYVDPPASIPTHVPLESGQYTDISIGPLPGFLRNEEMLVPPVVSEQVLAAARQSNIIDDEEEVRIVPMVPKKRSSLSNEDYINPQDAKNEVAAMKQHEKVIKKVSKGRSGKRSSDPSLPFPPPRPLSDRDDYTTVVNALPQGDFERVDMTKGGAVGGGGGRMRTSSDASPIMSARWSGHTGDSGKGSNNDSPNTFKKTSSVRDYKRPKHLDNTTPSKTQPIRRRSTLQQKELVSFDPQKGFKLTAKCTNSDGVPSIEVPPPTNGQDSPVSDPGQSFVQHGFDEGFIEGFNAGHVYAAVDLKAKCRPEDDVMRREGVGVPEHYIAPVTCN